MKNRDIDSRVDPAPLEASQTAFCRRCGAVGTIVDMGYCCRVADLTHLDAVSERFRPLPGPRGHVARHLQRRAA